ncbi:adenosine receptor A2b-like [Montipora capricornis]|uniref:adenosine receptor A2b-like n=1 Tax=Montipora foliosa TaxID=591990 RepID=UPI0035F2195D
MNISDVKSESEFCDRLRAYLYIASTGNDSFKAAFVVNAILNVPFCIIATLANLVVIFSIWRSPTLRSPANLLLIGLALSDLGVGLIMQPFYIAFLIYFAIQGISSSTCISTVAVALAGSFFSCVSFVMVTAISLERYLSLRLHLRYEELVTVKRVRYFLIISWLLFGISSFIWVLFLPKFKSFYYSAGILLCLLICTGAYVKIYRIVRFHVQHIKNLEVCGKVHRRKKVAYNMFVVYCALLCCYLPYSIFLGVAKIAGYSKWNWICINFTLTVVNINSSINPLIYCYRMRDIRRAILHTLYVALSRFKLK